MSWTDKQMDEMAVLLEASKAENAALTQELKDDSELVMSLKDKAQDLHAALAALVEACRRLRETDIMQAGVDEPLNGAILLLGKKGR
ncbi:MAG: hypothetical protein ACYSWU_17720 [Planctomycetota bacterium]